MIAYKLFNQRKDGSIGPLFINASQRIPTGRWLPARHDLSKKGFAYRPGWHCTNKPVAPHLSEAGRVWMMVEIEDYQDFQRPEHQGGMWYLANQMKVIGPVEKSGDLV